MLLKTEEKWRMGNFWSPTLHHIADFILFFPTFEAGWTFDSFTKPRTVGLTCAFLCTHALVRDDQGRCFLDKHQTPNPHSPLSSLSDPLASPFSRLNRDLMTFALPKRLNRVRTFSWYHSNVPIFRTLQKRKWDSVSSDTFLSEGLKSVKCTLNPSVAVTQFDDNISDKRRFTAAKSPVDEEKLYEHFPV